MPKIAFHFPWNNSSFASENTGIYASWTAAYMKMSLTHKNEPYKQSMSLLDVILKHVDSQTVLGGIRCGWMQYDNNL